MVCAVPGCPNVAATIRVLCLLAWCQAATRTHPAAACVLPVLRPTIPSWPSNVLVVADHAGHRNDGRGLSRDRGQRGHSHRRHAETHLVGRGADRGRVQAGRVGVAGVGHAQAAGGGVHPRYERGLAAGVPPREYPGHVVGRGQQQRRQRLALGEHLPGDDGHERFAARACDGYAAASEGWTSISGPDPSAVRGWSCRITYAVITLATLAIGAGRVAPGPYTTPKPLTSAAEAPSAGHETAASRSWSGVAVAAPGVTVPAPGVTVPGGDVADPEGDAFSSAMAKPARQASAASRARIPLCRR